MRVRASANNGSATFWIPPDEAGIEQAEGDAHVVGRGGRGHFGWPAHRMVQVHTLVPDRVPDGIGDRFYVAMTPVDQDDVEVAVGAQRASPIASDRKKCQVTVGFSHGALGDGGEPFVGLGGVGPAEIVALELGARQEHPASFPE